MKKYLAAAGFSALALLATTAPAQNKVYRIIGTVTSDGAIDGTTVIACSVPYQECKTKVETKVNKLSMDSGSFTLNLPTPGPYQVLAWTDVDGDGDSNAGDFIGIANDGNGLTAPKLALRIDMAALSDEAAAEGKSSANSDVPALAGTWTQASNTTELVIAPTIKFQPSMATGYGTNLGGTFGPGSATNTTIVTESKPVSVKRNMSLKIGNDGSFRWNITKVQPEGKCTKTLKAEKLGRITTRGNQMTFNITGGTDGFSSSCGQSGNYKLNGSSETYTFSKSGSSLTLSGGGGVKWTFRKG